MCKTETGTDRRGGEPVALHHHPRVTIKRANESFSFLFFLTQTDLGGPWQDRARGGKQWRQIFWLDTRRLLGGLAAAGVEKRHCTSFDDSTVYPVVAWGFDDAHHHVAGLEADQSADASTSSWYLQAR